MTGAVDINSCKCPPSCQCIYKNTALHDIAVGSVKLMEDKGYAINEEMRKFVAQSHAEGRTVIMLAAGGAVRICVALADEPKPESALLIKQLSARGIRSVMVTGDNAFAARRVAKAIGIEDPDANVFAQQLPQDKAAVVKRLQDEGLVVAFVGDGVNDSPALTQANVGIALGAGTEVAIESADAVLVRNSLADIITFFDLSAATVNRIYLNFAWAFVYNIVALPFASGVFFPLFHWQLPPVVAGISMIVSSLTVLTSSLLLKCFTPKWVIDDAQLENNHKHPVYRSGTSSSESLKSNPVGNAPPPLSAPLLNSDETIIGVGGNTIAANRSNAVVTGEEFDAKKIRTGCACAYRPDRGEKLRFDADETDGNDGDDEQKKIASPTEANAKSCCCSSSTKNPSNEDLLQHGAAASSPSSQAQESEVQNSVGKFYSLNDV